MNNIFKLLILLSTLLVTVYAENINECKTDIYFGNGVWNSRTQAEDNMIELQYIINNEIINNDSILQAKYGEVKLQYNWGQGRMLDVLETYYQLKEAGQVEDYQFYAVIAILTRGNPSLTLSSIATQELLEPFTREWEEGNVNEMWENYYNESFKLSHRVLLISHSQGNMFANRVYENINPTEYNDYFANLQVASPASEIKASKGDYVTLSTNLTSFDPIINLIPGSMSPNVAGDSGHEFIGAYLLQEEPLNKIIEKTKQLLADLDTESSQWQTDQELNKGTKDYKITVKHRFDSSITSMNGIEVYPFNASKKLYHVKDETPGGNGWVKASCGGDEVFDEWDGQKDDEEYLINNIEKEKIINGAFVFTVKYSIEYYIINTGSKWHRSSYNEYVLKPNSSCPVYRSGGTLGDLFGNYYGDYTTSEQNHFSTLLPVERYEHEYYNLNDEQNRYGSLVKCMISEEGYVENDIKSIKKGDEKYYLINDDPYQRSYQEYYAYILEQDYIVNFNE